MRRARDGWADLTVEEEGANLVAARFARNLLFHHRCNVRATVAPARSGKRGWGLGCQSGDSVVHSPRALSCFVPNELS